MHHKNPPFPQLSLRQTPDTIVARLGEYDYSRPEETRFRDFRVQSIKQHEEYQASTYTNDISIVTLSSATSFNTYIWPVCLPPFGRSFENATALVAGWGQNKYLGPVSKVLLQVRKFWVLGDIFRSIQL